MREVDKQPPRKEIAWKWAERDAQEVIVRGRKYLSLRHRPLSLCYNVAYREPADALLEPGNQWGPGSLIILNHAREILRQDPTRRDMIVPCFDAVDENPLSCISLLHILVVEGKFVLNVYSRSTNWDEFDADVELLSDLVAWFLDALPGAWEDWDPVIRWTLADFHKEVP